VLLNTQENISHWLVENFSFDVLANAGFLLNVATKLQVMLKERKFIQVIVAGNIYGCASHLSCYFKRSEAHSN
jgi:hypothetical protein